jgi:ABC-2 type transport system permease protein
MESSLGNLIARKDLLRELTLSELRSQSKETQLGWIWWILDPIFMMLIYWGVVAGIFGRGERYAPYPVFVLCAMLPWKHFQTSASQACNVLRAKESLIKSVPFPTIVLPMSQVLSGFAYFAAGIAVLLAAALAFRLPLGEALVQIPALMALQIVLVIGISLTLASFGALLHDLVAFVQYLLRVGFYLTPTLYGLDMVLERFERGALEGTAIVQWIPTVFMLNPFALLITGYRDAIFYGRFLELRHWGVLTLESLLLLVIGFWIFRYYDRRVIKFL